MSHSTLREAERFQLRIVALLEDPHDWLGYEHIRSWLHKLLRRKADEGYTPPERAAVARIIAARTPFEGWGDYTVQELVRAALRYAADFSYDDELFLKELEARHPTRLCLDDMRPRFNPEVDTLDEAA
jgi:hypothetical protein